MRHVQPKSFHPHQIVMSSRGRGRREANAVRGPTSALTSFLREKGIRARNIVITPDAENADAPGILHTADVGLTSTFQTSSIQPAPQVTLNAQLNEPQVNEPQHANQPQVLLKEPSKKPRSKKKPKIDSSDDEDAIIPQNNPNSLVAFCSKCNRRFARSSFMTANPSAKQKREANLCHACLSMASGIDSATRAKARKKTTSRKLAEQYDIGADGQLDNSGDILTLKGMCVKVIADNIDQVEEFGDIGPDVRLRISRILSRHRSLNGENLKLFLSPEEQSLRLFDCTLIDEDGFRLIPAFAPNLTVLQLDFCGRMTDPIVRLLAEKCRFLTDIVLKGPFLVTNQAWRDFFEMTGPRLQRFVTENAPKIGKEALQMLAKQSKDGNLRELSFSRCTGINNSAILQLIDLNATNLYNFVACELHPELNDNGVQPLIECIGVHFVHLDISCNPNITYATVNAIRDTCESLRGLNLAECTNVDQDCLVDMFVWKKDRLPVAEAMDVEEEPEELVEDALRHLTGLTHLDVGRIGPTVVDDGVLHAIGMACAPTLRSLRLTGADGVTKAALQSFIAKAPHLWDLDLSWVRACDDDLMDYIVERCPEVRKIRIWGCHRVTEFGSKRRRFNSKQQPVTIEGSEFD